MSDNAKAQTCPHCGYCPTCGRHNGYWTQPPWWPYQPYIHWTVTSGTQPLPSYGSTTITP